jgi:universal stress protein E
MASLQRIVVSVGGAQDGSPAADRAAQLAAASGAALRRVSSVDCEQLLSEAGQLGADLLVTARSRSPADRSAALTQADWDLIRRSPCPVLLTRSASAAGYREILVAVDPMHEHDRPAALDDELIALAGRLAGACGARLRLVHCYLPPQYLPFRAPGAVGGISRDGPVTRLEAHQEALKALAVRHGVPESSVLLEPADPRDGIPDTARRLAADLVVMGAVARSRLRRLLIGSTAEPVLDQLACDVLVVKPPVVG